MSDHFPDLSVDSQSKLLILLQLENCILRQVSEGSITVIQQSSMHRSQHAGTPNIRKEQCSSKSTAERWNGFLLVCLSHSTLNPVSVHPHPTKLRESNSLHTEWAQRSPAQTTVMSCQLQPTHNDLPFPVPKVQTCVHAGDQRENLCSALSTTKIKPSVVRSFTSAMSVFSDFTDLDHEDVYCNLGCYNWLEKAASRKQTWHTRREAQPQSTTVSAATSLKLVKHNTSRGHTHVLQGLTNSCWAWRVAVI